MGWIPFETFRDGRSSASAHEVVEPAGCATRPLHMVNVEGDNSIDPRGYMTVYETRDEAVAAAQRMMDKETLDASEKKRRQEAERQRLEAHVASVLAESGKEHSLAALWDVIYYDMINSAHAVDCYLRRLGIDVLKRSAQ